MDLRRRMIQRADQYAKIMKEAVAWHDELKSMTKETSDALWKQLDRLDEVLGEVYPIDGNEKASHEINKIVNGIRHLCWRLKKVAE